MRLCIIGAGAMGGIYGGLLAKKGFDVTLVDIRREHVEAINRNGLRLDGITGDLTIQVPATTDPDTGWADAASIQTDTTPPRPRPRPRAKPQT
ncbi:MAG: 2-dehydropantoate 2-reductase N-terminal domain-containing protein [Gammaproteobacteria bacterium]